MALFEEGGLGARGGLDHSGATGYRAGPVLAARHLVQKDAIDRLARKLRQLEDTEHGLAGIKRCELDQEPTVHDALTRKGHEIGLKGLERPPGVVTADHVNLTATLAGCKLVQLEHHFLGRLSVGRGHAGKQGYEGEEQNSPHLDLSTGPTIAEDAGHPAPKHGLTRVPELAEDQYHMMRIGIV